MPRDCESSLPRHRQSLQLRSIIKAFQLDVRHDCHPNVTTSFRGSFVFAAIANTDNRKIKSKANGGGKRAAGLRSAAFHANFILCYCHGPDRSHHCLGKSPTCLLT
ncbi:hypothetical protein Thiowin_01103 [Thiorhodovibrio winogradskyi]|uniref:Uncharacterized protein n=1 Tax=Thiorhodovibrio winogradskyi TaxID=77007 RepID=A0ABZ0S7F1_9GAMM